MLAGGGLMIGPVVGAFLYDVSMHTYAYVYIGIYVHVYVYMYVCIY